jgi:hypothetical protein
MNPFQLYLQFSPPTDLKLLKVHHPALRNLSNGATSLTAASHHNSDPPQPTVLIPSQDPSARLGPPLTALFLDRHSSYEFQTASPPTDHSMQHLTNIQLTEISETGCIANKPRPQSVARTKYPFTLLKG